MTETRQVPAAQLFRLSPQQRRLWLLAPEGGGPYRALVRVEIEGRLEPDELETALAATAARHEILRTTFPRPAGMSLPGQAVHEEPAAPPLDRRDLTGLAPEEQEAAREEIWEELAARPFRPDREPPWAAVLAMLAPERHHLFLALHALCADESSLGVLVEDLRRARAGEAAEPPVQYADVAAVLEELLDGEESEAGRAWWKEVLPAAPPATASLPFEREAGTAPFAPRWVEAALDPTLAAQPAEIFLAAWQALLARLSPLEPVLGIELAGRHYEGFDTAVGAFARSVPVRVEVRGDEPFARLAALLGEQIASAEEWQDYFSWERIPGGEGGLFAAVFRFVEDGKDGGGRFRLMRSRAVTDRFRLRLTVRGAVAELGYDAARFRESEARTLLASWRELLANAVAHPETPVGELELVSPQDRSLLEAWNATDRPFEPVPVHQLFFEQARRTPNAVALSTVPAGEVLSYEELAGRVTVLAASLREAGVGPDVPVALGLERSVEMVVGALAILAAGGAYVPLDPSYPEARRALILEVSGAVVVVEPGLVVSKAAGRPVPASNPLQAHTAAYVLFTSGSTGTPKGVVVRHGSLSNHMLWMQDAYPLAPGDRVLQKTPLGFDASVWELFAPLLAGAELVLAAPEAHRDPAALARATAESGATVLQVVPSLLRLLLAEEAFAACSSLRRLYCGGEPLPAELADRVHALVPGADLINLYGPTETTVQVATWVAERGGAVVAGETVPIGRPIHNARIWVLDEEMRRLPPGLPGELWIGGAASARGYLGRPDLTAASFLPDPFAAEPGSRLYRTGDLGRHREDGALVFLGRVGREVKIRGYRFDPGEIEDLLGRVEGVREAAVGVREDLPGGQRLVAWVVPESGQVEAIDPTALRAHLAAHLPDFLVPSAFVSLAALPRTSSGKLDRNALPAPAPEAGEESGGFVAPRTAVEEVLTGIWSDLLGRDRVGVHDDFFELGGHSLLGAQLVAHVRQVLGVELSLRTVFETPTVAGLAVQVTAARQGEMTPAPPLLPVPRTGEIPLSFAQQRLWFLDRLAPGDPAYNVFSAVRFTGRLDGRALLAAFREIVRVQETLRTTFPTVGGRPVQRPAPALALDLPVVDLAALPAEARFPEALRLARAEARRPFELARGPLLRLTLLCLGAETHLLFTGLHHIVSDAWSVGIFYRDLMALYAAPGRLPEPPVQYADFAVWQRRWFAAAREREIGWWRGRLADLPPLRLPADRPARLDAEPSRRGIVLPFTLSGAVSAALRRRARAESATLFMLLLAAFQALLSRWSGQDDVAVGVPVANRERAEIEGLIGFFVNTLVLRTSCAGDPSFSELLGRVREVALGAFAHQAVPFEALVEELAPERGLADAGRQPLFQVMFQLHNVPLPRFVLPGVEAEPLDVDPGGAPFDLTLDLLDTPEGLTGILRASADRFDAPTVHRLLGHLEILYAAVATADPARLSGLPLLTAAEGHQTAVEWNDNARPYESEASIPDLFAARAAQTPDAAALSWGAERLTYAGLEARTNRLARYLLRQGAGPETRVAIRLESSIGFIAGLLAILKTGAAYVPLDPAWPEARAAHLLAESGADAVLVPSDTAVRAALARESPAPLPPRAAPESLAYVLFTSGSTGRPKGVAVPHRAVVRLVRGTGCLPVAPGDRIGQVSHLAFDSATFEIWGALLNGGCLAGLPREEALSPRALAAWLRRERITIFLSPTALLHQVAREEPAAFEPLRYLTAGGEALDAQRARDVVRAGKPGHFFNVYGPTETTCFVTWEPVVTVPDGLRTIPLGRPIGNTFLRVLGPHLAPVPIGVEGELCIGGEALARGYLGQPALTAERFVPDPGGDRGARLYRTGDRARLLPDGRVEFLGRLDGQIKLRGFRIEPGEIEQALAAHPEVAAAVVLPRQEPGGGRLTAFVVPETLDPAALRAWLRERLPEFMVPASFVRLPALPLNRNNKVDRDVLARAVPVPAEGATGSGGGDFATPVEEVLAEIWCEVLGVARVHRDDNFFDLSGHSLLAAQVAWRVEQAFGVEIPLLRFFERFTLAALAREVEEARRRGRPDLPPAPPFERAPRDRPLPASFAQEWVWHVQGGPVSARYNMSQALRLRGPLAPAVLARSFTEIVRRHETLRTALHQEGGEMIQEVLPPADFPVPLADLSALPESRREEQLQALVRAAAGQPFDLRRAPLLRALLVRAATEEHVLAFTLHHAMGDGWSLVLLQRELSLLYAAESRGLPAPLPPLLWQYADFAHWQRRVLEGAPVEAQIDWWRRRLAGVPPPPGLPSRRPRPPRLGPAAVAANVPLPPGLSAELKAFARAEGCTLSMALLAGLAALLYRQTGREDFLLAVVHAGRGRPGLADLIGILINVVPLRADLSGAPGFRELLRRVREGVLESAGFQDVSFPRLFTTLFPEHGYDRTAVFRVAFNMLSFLAEPEVPAPAPGAARLSIEPLEGSPELALYDLALACREQEDGALLCRWTGAADLYDPEDLTTIGADFAGLLAAALADPDARLASTEIETEKETGP